MEGVRIILLLRKISNDLELPLSFIEDKDIDNGRSS